MLECLPHVTLGGGEPCCVTGKSYVPMIKLMSCAHHVEIETFRQLVEEQLPHAPPIFKCPVGCEGSGIHPEWLGHYKLCSQEVLCPWLSMVGLCVSDV